MYTYQTVPFSFHLGHEPSVFAKEAPLAVVEMTPYLYLSSESLTLISKM